MTKPLPLTLLCIIALAFSSVTVPAGAATKKKKVIFPDVKKALARELPKAAIGGTLNQTLLQFGNLLNIPVTADWGGLENVGVKRSTRVSVRVPKKISGEKLLELILMRVSAKGKPLSWYVSSGVLVVTTQQAVLGRKSLTRVRNMRKPVARTVTRTTLRTHSFKNEPLKNVIAFYRNVSDVNFHVNWKSLANAGIDKEEPITLIAKGVSLSKAMDMITDQLSEGKDKYESVYWMVNRGVVTISTGHALNTNTIVTIHEVGDLLFSAPNFKGPRLGRSTKGAGDESSNSQGIFDLGASGNTTDTVEKETAAETRAQAKSSLEKIITDSIGEEMWISGGGKGSIRYFRNKLIISQTRLGYMLMKQAGVLDGFKQIK
ncbi:MAG: hypothetical protein QGG42_03405 [Phycisphaerae bacterium]|jgi:hypothetical protein|nr:hypothetical protein [Phycisphaerae bacterium]